MESKMMLHVIFLCFLWYTTTGALTVSELHAKYNEVFPRTHDRTAGGHLWSTYILRHVGDEATTDEIYELFSAFCPVSGARVNPSPYHLWKNLKIKNATNAKETVTRRVSFCCDPCPCDTEDFVRVDTKQIKTKDNMTSFEVLVIGDPCEVPRYPIPGDAVELYCENGKLHGATLSDHGYVIIGMVQPSSKYAARDAASVEHQNECEDRRYHGYHGPVGTIFMQLARINTIN